MVVRLLADAQSDLELVSVGSASEARRAVERQAFDLLLLDVMMPETDGPTLLRELRRRPELAQVPAVFLTAKAHPDDLRRLSATSAQAVVTKPFDAADLVERLHHLLAAPIG